MINPVIIFGAGTHGKMALDILKSNDVIVYGFLDDNKELHQSEIGEVPVLGHSEDEAFLKLIGKKCDAVVAVEDARERISVTKLLMEERKIMPVNAFHIDSSISGYAKIGHGNLVAAGARVSAFSEIGNGCLLHPNAVIETDSILGDHVVVGAGSVVGAGAIVEHGAFIGAGVTVLAGVKIGKNASVGAGSVVLENVPAKARVFGFPAKPV